MMVTGIAVLLAAALSTATAQQPMHVDPNFAYATPSAHSRIPRTRCTASLATF